MKKHISKRAIGLTAMAMMAAAANPYFKLEREYKTTMDAKRKQRIQEMALRNAINKQRIPEHEYIIHGHYVIAKSRKDAIKILKHKGFLK
jgi:predicted nucleotide-binding protein